MTLANSYNFLVVFFVTFGSLTYGYNSAIIGAVIGLPSFFEYFNIDIKSNKGSQITGGMLLVYLRISSGKTFMSPSLTDLCG